VLDDVAHAGIVVDRLPGDDAHRDQGDRAVQDRSDDERRDDAEGDVLHGILGLFRRDRYRVEADVREENERSRRVHPTESGWEKRMEPGRMDGRYATQDERDNRDDLRDDQHGVGARRFTNADREQPGDDEDDECRDQVDLRMREVEPAICERDVRRLRPDRHVEARPGEQRLQISRPRCRGRRHADAVLEDQVPADDPRDDFTERGVRVGVRAAGDRHHRGQLRVTECDEDARERRKRERQYDPGSRGCGPDANRREDTAEHRPEADADQTCATEDPTQRRTFVFGAHAIERLHREQVAKCNDRRLSLAGSRRREFDHTRTKRKPIEQSGVIFRRYI
jgi:hypothetical protein